ncbi:hypothetical protein ACVRZS_08600 [Streptococcus ferus]|uniref:Uncharacterized protein n=1 Tax=Streptococcus ferus TaxID=1345 RepID=A0A2X3VIR9_9STRE|nr:hypothetical protein [Streptococcus ferus]SQF39438.1 Uncharacterised protein [Streptococcus ferus]
MKAIFKGNLFQASRYQGKIRIGSDKKSEGFVEYVDVLGNLHKDHFVRLLDERDLDYLYELSYELKYKGRWFHLFTALNPRAISEDYFEIILSFLDLEEKELAEKLGFERTDKFYYTKRLYRKDIEELKVIELPQGIFSSQGKKERILEGEEIDDYFASITD